MKLVPKRADERPSLRVRASFFFFLFLLLGETRGDGHEGAEGWTVRTRKEREASGNGSRREPRGQNAVAVPVRQRENFLWILVKMRHIPRARFVKMVPHGGDLTLTNRAVRCDEIFGYAVFVVGRGDGPREICS